MKAEIITSGTELLLGEITDTNAPFLAGQLAALGINLYYTSTVGDNFGRYSEVLRRAWERSDLIITTGGLGPTQGDITREVIAGLLGEEMTIVPELKQELIDFFARLRLELTENNFKQATIIPSGRPLRNTAGTAPGWWVEKDGRIILALPGPPREMQAMWYKAVLPELTKRCSAVIVSRTLKTWGLSESKVDEMVAPYLSSPNPTLAMYAKMDGIQLRVTARADTREAADRLIKARESEILELLKDNIWGYDDDTLQGVLGRELVTRKLTMAVAESFTRGLLAHSLATTPGWEEFFRGGLFISPGSRNEWGLGNPDGDAAKKMASLARERFGADIGLAVDGSLELEPGKSEIFIAAAGKEKTGVTSPHYPGRPDQAVGRTINHALTYLRNFINAI